jgi:hypothetical protein
MHTKFWSENLRYEMSRNTLAQVGGHTKMYLTKMVCEVVYCISLTQWGLRNLRIPYNTGDFLTRQATDKFSKVAVLRGDIY